jgi:protein O-GlcNAc transferase
VNIEEAIRLALKNYQEGNLGQAERICRKMLKNHPGNFDIHNCLGNILQDKGDLEEAKKSYQKAIELNPTYFGSYYNMGDILQEQGYFDDAIVCYEKVIKLNPIFAWAYNNLGHILQGKGRIDDALTYYKKAIEIDPTMALAYNNIGNVQNIKKQYDEAISYYQKALQLNPNLADAYNNMGNSYQDKGQYDEAISYYQKALQLNPNFVDAYNNMGNSYQDKGQYDEAISCYQKALQLNPNFVDAYNNMGISYKEKGQYDEAISCYQKALQLNPNFAGAYNNMGIVYKDKGQIDEAEICFRHAIGINQDSSTTYSNLLLTMEYNAHHHPRTIYLEHLIYFKKYAEHFTSIIYPHKNSRDPNRKLKIGYVSPDFRRHPVSYFSESVIIEHNREYFEVFCYSNNPIHDKVTQRIQENADQWRNIVGISDEDVTELIQKDKIDILVDLAGHTAYNRILVFAQKPTPIQISWIGYLTTTGLSTMDYKIADNYTDPIGKTNQFYTEKILRLPESFLCYLPDKDAPDVGKLPALLAGHITFGSFNNFSKVTPEVFLIWAKILNELPDSCLILKGKSFRDKTTCQYAIDMFKQRDIAAHRIILQPPDPSPKHLESYNLVDIGLDTFPFNGAATTCEAMWMGVPVITIAGIAYHSSVGISLLSNVGLKDLIAKTHDEYVRLAVNLANDIERLKNLRSSLRDKMTHSPLTDAKRFTINLENSYREIWKTWCQSV